MWERGRGLLVPRECLFATESGRGKRLGGMLMQDCRSGALLCGDRVQGVTMSLECQM